MDKILITGGSGLLGTNWALLKRNDFEIILGLHIKKIKIKNVRACQLNMKDEKELEKQIAHLTPNIIIHTAAITDVEKCEKEVELADKINVDLTETICKICKKINIKFVFISTDHLFDGLNAFSTENSLVNPLNNYARTKVNAEKAVINANPEALIIRTNFFGWGTKYRKSFSDFIINNLRNNNQITLFENIYFTPIIISELVNMVHELIDKNKNGIFNVCGNERISKYQFGIKISKLFSLKKSLIKKGSIDQFKDLAKRPKDMSLSNDKVCKALNCKLLSRGLRTQACKNQLSLV